MRLTSSSSKVRYGVIEKSDNSSNEVSGKLDFSTLGIRTFVTTSLVSFAV